MDMSLSKVREMVMNRDAWCAAVHGVSKSPMQLNWLNWTQVQAQDPHDMIYNNKELETNVLKGEAYVAVLVLHNTETQNMLGPFSRVQLFMTP